ncbi:MAG: Hpt domain-containing protein [Rhizobacter sp.]|nr:Hpt domain-containing protein [Rhizobacter sp.]
MDSLRNPPSTDSRGDDPESQSDLSALSWVQDELRRSLELAHKALRRHLKESETTFDSDVDAADPAVIHGARQHIHQGVGALELVGLPAGANLLRACEAAVQRCIAKPRMLDIHAVATIESASFAVLDYVARLLSGKTVSPLAMFPQYRAVQELAGADRVHPADLWTRDWQWQPLPDDELAVPRAPDAATRSAIEGKMLSIMRNPTPATASRMSDICAGLGAGTDHPQTSTLWKLAAAMFEAQSQGLLSPDVFSKRVASRLLAQLRIFERGGREVSERLARDLLFFCAQADSPGDGRRAPRLAAVRQAYGLVHHLTTDYHVSALGRFDPAVIAQARKRVAAAKESWSGVAGGEMHRLNGLAEQFALAGESLKRLFPSGELLAEELRAAAAQAQQSAAPPSAPLAMEAATSLLYVEACLEDAEFDHPELGARVQRMSQRMASVRQGEPPQPLEGWMEDLYRRVSDRQTMGSVVQELRATLSEAEKLIDQFFRNPADPEVLIPVPNHLSAMRGVLSVLGMDHAASALLRMRDEVDGLSSTEVDVARVPQAGVFDRLADNLGALGFLIDMLSVQPTLAKTLFTYDADSGTLSPVMGRGERKPVIPGEPAPAVAEPRLIEQAQMLAFNAAREDVSIEAVTRDLERLAHEATAADQPALAATVNQARVALEKAQDSDAVSAARDQLSEALADFVHTSSEAVGLEPATTAGRDVGADESVEDEEMREVFLEEALEVFETARGAVAELAAQPADLQQLTIVRRAFHTLKGSARMVGLTEFGDAAWVCEQLYNTRLSEQQAADSSLLDFTAWSLDQFADWVGDIAASRATSHTANRIREAAAQLQAGAEAPVIEAVPALPPVVHEFAFAASDDADSGAVPPDFTMPADFELDMPGEVPAAESMPEVLALDELDFDALVDLDLNLPATGVESSPEVAFDSDSTMLLRDPAKAGPADSGLLALDLEASEAQSMFEPFDPEATQPLPHDSLLTRDELPEAVDSPSFELLNLDLGSEPFSVSDEEQGEATLESQPELVALLEAEPEIGQASELIETADEAPDADEAVKVIGSLRIGIPLFNIYLNEADELSRRLCTELAEWAMELDRPVGDTAVALAHSLAGSSATVGFADLSNLSRTLEHALSRCCAIGSGTSEEGALFVDAADEIRHLLHQFAAGFLKQPSEALLARLAEHELSSAQRLDTAVAELDAESLLDSEGAPLDPPIHLDFSVSTDVPRLDPLGVAELKSLDESPVPDSEPIRSAQEGAPQPFDDDEDIDAIDAIDAELFPIFEEEGEELLGELAIRLQDWVRQPDDASQPAGAMRTLHTLKGGARLAGAMRLGELVHRLESRIENLMSQSAEAALTADDVEPLLGRCDVLRAAFEAVQRAAASTEEAAAPEAVAVARPVEMAPPVSIDEEAAVEETEAVADSSAAQAAPAPVSAPGFDSDHRPVDSAANAEVDWSRFGASEGVVEAPRAPLASISTAAVRVRAPLLDRLVNQAGEVSITRSRIASDVQEIKGSLSDLTENLDRLRGQLRDIELQAETQISARMEAAKVSAQAFDPLEFDRFTRFQELTRMMAESVNDVATVQRTLQRSLQSTEDELAAQARLTRELQDDLLRTRMVEFEGLSDRLYRVVRQAAKETGKQVRLDIVGGSIEIDRGVLDRMTGAFEHLLRNSVTHGIESPETRVAAGKDATGGVVVAVSQDGNEVSVEVRDDGRGLDLERIRAKGVATGLITEGAALSDGDLANLIFTAGFSTADKVTELSGRGVGMDVVRSEVVAIGGRIETSTTSGKGSSFKLVLPLTTAVTQVVMVRCGDLTVGIPSPLIVSVRRVPAAEMEQAHLSGSFTVDDSALPFFWLGALLQTSSCSAEPAGRSAQVLVIRSASQRIVIHVDDVVGNEEVVVKNLGPQLSRMPGLAGMTLMASGDVVLIYNPVALATLYGSSARVATQSALQSRLAGHAQPAADESPARTLAPLVLVVDDSLTVRRVTERMLLREGYRVMLAKDGLDALEQLAKERPAIVLSDIEMPRMDGFDLVRNLRADARLSDLPVIMITSRIAQKHRDYAAQLGVEHYLGKPYSEEDLLALIARCTAVPVVA